MKNFNHKSWLLILGMMLSTVFISCEEQEEEINLAENEMQREEVFQQILNDEDLFTEFIAEMRDNRQMMRNLYTREQVEAMMMTDPEVIDAVLVDIYSTIERDSMLLRNPERREQVMRNMMNMMERDTAMYREMQQRMQQNRMQ